MKDQMNEKNIYSLENTMLSLQWENERLRNEINNTKETELKETNLQLINDKTRLNGLVICLEKEKASLEQKFSDCQYQVDLL